jgi:hypothetical protein
MTRTNYRTMLAASCALAVLAAPAMAGEFQLGFRMGKNHISIDGDRLSSGNSVDERLINLGILASYRWESGGYLEAGLGGSGSFDILGIQGVSHRWIGGGWQFDLSDYWKLTPKAGLTWSHLTSSEEDFFDSEPVDEFSDVVPFMEMTLERRLWNHVGLGLYVRRTMEDWGSTTDAGLSLSWTFQ